ncbi:hypothetical protein BCR44DRAFT_1444107 [Catenaria anguillulae PL171]|uniref:Uncharacterized protein n=1 Tax=Catenaria anguillulae PL171 TaxID=765915 RepID=A0A1Y2H7T3_9FUNG|nr:hypothetical protein BCR44DRAFT_1444107 [Catenaria anguillulae PL171]
MLNDSTPSNALQCEPTAQISTLPETASWPQFADRLLAAALDNTRPERHGDDGPSLQLPPFASIQDLARQTYPLFRPRPPNHADASSSGTLAIEIAHIVSRIIHHAAPQLAPRSSLECMDQFRTALGQVRLQLTSLSAAQVARADRDQFGEVVWTLAMLLGVCARMYLDSGPYGQEIRGAAVKVEAVARSIGKVSVAVRERMDMLDNDEERTVHEKEWLLGLHTFLISQLHTCQRNQTYRPFAHQLLLPFHDLDPSSTNLSHIPTALLYPAHALASLAPHLLTRFALAVPTLLHATHRMLTAATKHFSAYPPPTRNHAYLMHCALQLLSDPAVCAAMGEYPVFLVTLMRALAEYLSGDGSSRRVASGVVDREVVKWMVKVQVRYAKTVATREDWERVLGVGAGDEEAGRAVLAKVVAAVEEQVCRVTRADTRNST